MEYDRIKNTVLPRALSDLAGDMADLLQKELRLARAEISAKIAAKFRAGAWMLAAGLLGLVCVLLVVQALVFGIASYGIALHWSSLIVAAILGVIGGLAFLMGRSKAAEDLAPTRALFNIKRDISTVKEQLT